MPKTKDGGFDLDDSILDEAKRERENMEREIENKTKKPEPKAPPKKTK